MSRKILVLLATSPFWAIPTSYYLTPCLTRHCELKILVTLLVVVISFLSSLVAGLILAKRSKFAFAFLLIPVVVFVLGWRTVYGILGVPLQKTLFYTGDTKDIKIINFRNSIVKKNGTHPHTILVEYELESKKNFTGFFYPNLEWIPADKVLKGNFNLRNLQVVSANISPAPKDFYGHVESFSSVDSVLGDYGFKKGIRYKYSVHFAPSFAVSNPPLVNSKSPEYRKLCLRQIEFETPEEWTERMRRLREEHSTQYSFHISGLPSARWEIDFISYGDLYKAYEAQQLPACVQNSQFNQVHPEDKDM